MFVHAILSAIGCGDSAGGAPLLALASAFISDTNLPLRPWRIRRVRLVVHLVTLLVRLRARLRRDDRLFIRLAALLVGRLSGIIFGPLLIYVIIRKDFFVCGKVLKSSISSAVVKFDGFF